MVGRLVGSAGSGDHAFVLSLYGYHCPDEGGNPSNDKANAEGENANDDAEHDHHDTPYNGGIEQPERAEEKGKQQRDAGAFLLSNDNNMPGCLRLYSGWLFHD